MNSRQYMSANNNSEAVMKKPDAAVTFISVLS